MDATRPFRLADASYAVHSARDAIGAVVVVNAGSRTSVHQLTAGDGYQASNERKLFIGLGRHRRVDGLQVRWPSGLVQEFEDLPADSELILIEGGSRPFVLSPSV